MRPCVCVGKKQCFGIKSVLLSFVEAGGHCHNKATIHATRAKKMHILHNYRGAGKKSGINRLRGALTLVLSVC